MQTYVFNLIKIQNSTVENLCNCLTQKCNLSL